MPEGTNRQSVNITGDMRDSEINQSIHQVTNRVDASEVDINEELDAIAEILNRLANSDPDSRDIVKLSLERATSEALNADPDRNRVMRMLDSAVGSLSKIGDAAESLNPHLERVAAWAGTGAMTAGAVAKLIGM